VGANDKQVTSTHGEEVVTIAMGEFSVEVVSDVPDDAALLATMAAGSEGGHEALRQLYDRHAPWLLVRLGRRCSDPGVVDEAVQDTFVAIWRKPQAYRGSGDVAAWIWGIGIRRLMDATRRRPAPPVAVGETLHHREETPARSAEEQVVTDLAYGDLADALRRLSPELRAVVRATVLDGMTTREAGRFLGIPHGTVKTRMKRARALLVEAMT
jgi:RNA polymerase sigma-70 factor, ECF subfamily